MDAGKPVAAIDDAVGILTAIQKLNGRTVTGPEALRETVEQAGAVWSEEPVAVDKVLVTARGNDDLTAFVEQVVKVFSEAAQVRKAA
jgi:protease I